MTKKHEEVLPLQTICFRHMGIWMVENLVEETNYQRIFGMNTLQILL
ncbi:MAG: hypothetical protein ACI4D2_05605 [Lachnospiraceae bacterium]